ncbi:MAG TPA: MmcQ/YjbR family DNA-binding protein [Candidatus Binatia bacterium]|nr:MmcQ/YjbR family DNA-binding protein [Candidatus Binatia bacterium]
MRKAGVSYDTVRRLALALPDVEESTSYGTPALKVAGQLFVRLHQDLDKIVLRMPFDRREEMMAADPETYFITDHYAEYPYILVSLAHVRADALPDLLNLAYRTAASPAKKRRV